VQGSKVKFVVSRRDSSLSLSLVDNNKMNFGDILWYQKIGRNTWAMIDEEMTTFLLGESVQETPVEYL
jgi:hypothetical protein